MFKRFKCYNVKTLKCYLALGAVLALTPWCLAGRVLLLLEPPCQGFVVVLSRRAVVKYQLVFRHLFRAKRLERRLLGVWTGHMATKDLYRSRDGRARRDLGRAFHLNARMLHFAQNLMHYTMFEVVEARHADLLADVDKARTVDDALKCHDVFLDFVLKECLLANHKLLGLLADLDRAARAFANAADRFRDAAGLR